MRGHGLSGAGVRSAVLTVGALLAAALPALAAGPSGAEQALMQGRVDEAIALLQGQLKAEPQNGRAQLLLCRAFYSEELADQAASACEQAAAAMPNDSETQDWAWRAYGLRADKSGPLTGLRMAPKVAAAFGAAYRLNPRNGDAADDLGEFDVQAPGMVGGGMDKAQALEKQLEGSMPERAQRLRALMAEKNKDYGTAEREFLGLAQTRAKADGWMDLASFYQRRKQADKAVDAVRHGIALDKTNDASLVHAADVLVKLQREPQLGITALRAYLGGSEMSDQGPACKAHYLLGKLLKQTGDTAGARAEFGKSLALASGYEKAKKELASL